MRQLLSVTISPIENISVMVAEVVDVVVEELMPVAVDLVVASGILPHQMSTISTRLMESGMTTILQQKRDVDIGI